MYQYRAYIKDCLDLSSKPKAFVVVPSFTIRRDLLTGANSTFKVLQMPSNIDNSDILCLYDPTGKVIYNGVITKIAEDEIQCSQMQSFYKGNWLAKTKPQIYLEDEVRELVKDYASGVNGDTDELMKIKLDLSVKSKGSNINKLPNWDEQSVVDFESFIYDLYAKYNIVFEFEIPFDTKGSVYIHTADYSAYKIANNTHAIIDISPITEIAQNNKLVIYSSEGEYRGTWYATPNGITTHSDDPLRLKTINTTITFSDDELDSLVSSSLTEQMYNHKLTFTLNLNNNLYDWSEWKLGQPLEIWLNGDYYNSIYTGYELVKAEGVEPTQVEVTCGKVRTSLTSKLLLRGIK